MNFSQIRKRNLEDQLTLYGSGITFLFVFPLSIYRLLMGDFLLGIIDSTVSIILLAVFIQTWQSKKIKYFKTFVILSFMTAILGLVYVRSTQMIFWAYPVIAASFFLLKAKSALYINCLFIISVGAIASHFKGLPIISVYPSLFLVLIFGFSFSLRSESQTKELQLLASEDVLTKVKNRRSFDEKVDEVIANNKRFEKPVCLLLLDLDLFKNINDTYGHKQGDIVLFEFAQAVKSIIRSTDDIYRFGGEEFAVIANHTSIAETGKFADTIRDFIQNCSELNKFNVTVSIGVSEINQNDDADSWFRRADLALYESKSKGRNRVYIAEQDTNDSIKLVKVENNPTFTVHPTPVTSREEDESISDNRNVSVDKTKNTRFTTLSNNID